MRSGVIFPTYTISVNFGVAGSYPKRDLLAPRRQERQVRKFNFFAAFAPLREICRVLIAAWLGSDGSGYETQRE